MSGRSGSGLSDPTAAAQQLRPTGNVSQNSLFWFGSSDQECGGKRKQGQPLRELLLEEHVAEDVPHSVGSTSVLELCGASQGYVVIASHRCVALCLFLNLSAASPQRPVLTCLMRK